MLGRRLTVWSMACALCACVGCAEKGVAGDPEALTLHGISVVDPAADDRQIVFLGYEQDLQSQLQATLNGTTGDSIWYRIHVPHALLAAGQNKTVEYDLGASGQIDIYRSDRVAERPLAANPGPHWTVYHYSPSASEILEGVISFSGPSVVQAAKGWKGVDLDGLPWGVAYRIHWRGYADVGGEKVLFDNQDTFGALFKACGGAQC